MDNSERRRAERFLQELAHTCMVFGIPLDGENPITHDLITVTIQDDGRAVAEMWNPSAKVVDPPDARAEAVPVPF